MPAITLPNNWAPRPYQLPVLTALDEGVKRAIAIWHRRAGKDDVCLHFTAKSMHHRIGNYWHMLPKSNQARKAIWTAINPHTGIRRIDEAFPLELRAKTLDQDMMIQLKCGSTWQVIGSDNFNALLGSPPIGVVFSEYALADPNSWSFLRPILAENGGWALFITTPRGRNHAARMYEGARGDPNWFAELLTVDDTGVISPDMIARERAEIARERGKDEADAVIDQEYYCSFDAALPGAYYGTLMTEAEKDGRICELPYDARYPVVTAWDLGIGDSTAIVFGQTVGPWLHIFDYYEASGVGADHYAKIVRERPYIYDEHLLPHDAEVGEWGANGTTRTAALRALNVRPLRVLARTSVEDRINAARQVLRRVRFDKVRCERLIDALRGYQKEWDERLQMWREKPVHDWTSHGADAFGYFAQGYRSPAERAKPPKASKLRNRRGIRPYGEGAWMG